MNVKRKILTFLHSVVVESLALLLRTREVAGSNLGPDTGYSDWFWLRAFVVFLSSSSHMLEEYLNMNNEHFIPHPFQFVVQTIILQFDRPLQLKKCIINRPWKNQPIAVTGNANLPVIYLLDRLIKRWYSTTSLRGVTSQDAILPHHYMFSQPRRPRLESRRKCPSKKPMVSIMRLQRCD
jgi:hypothetical protein